MESTCTLCLTSATAAGPQTAILAELLERGDSRENKTKSSDGQTHYLVVVTVVCDGLLQLGDAVEKTGEAIVVSVDSTLNPTEHCFGGYCYVRVVK